MRGNTMARTPNPTSEIATPPRPGQKGPFEGYQLGAAFDEMFDAKGEPRPGWAGLGFIIV
jgi:hypothetical protein